MSIAALPAAAEVVGARAAAAGGSRAAAGAGSSKAASLPRDPGAHVAKLRGQGMDNQQIRKALRDMGYDSATAANVSPGNDVKTQRLDGKDVNGNAIGATPNRDGTWNGNPTAADLKEESQRAAVEAAQAAGPEPSTSPSGPSFGQRVSNRPPSSGGPSGLLLGLMLYPVALAYLRDGFPGVKAWFNAKFLNRVSSAPATPGSSGNPAPGAPSPAPGGGAGGGGGSSW